MSVIHVHTESEYNRLKTVSGKLVIVDFSASWCGPCKQIAPKYEMFANNNPSIVCLHVDVDELETLPDCQAVRGVPTFKFYKDGRFLEEFSGADINRLVAVATKHA